MTEERRNELYFNLSTIMKTAQRRLDVLREREEYEDDDLRWEHFLEDEEARPGQTVAR